jgi:hypothetical protein
MMEALGVVAFVLLLVLVGTLMVAVSIETLLASSAVCIALGLILGVPAGVGYHVALYRCLAQRGPVEWGFVWRPRTYHPLLAPTELRRVLPWFVTGALGFGLIVLGSLVLVLGLWRS